MACTTPSTPCSTYSSPSIIMASSSSSPLVFTVRRNEPELIVPAQPTPNEVKSVSDIDDQVGHTFHIDLILFYRNVVGMEDDDPVKVIREAITKALVYYYPYAGRLREGPNGKLMVECTGEGVIFVEADANVRLEQFGDVIQPPFPCTDELLYTVPGSGGVFNSPLLLFQVTRMMCGGFICGVRLVHVMSDAFGLCQFMKAVTEMVSGACAPSVRPVWERHLLTARDPPRVSCVHPVYHDLSGGKETPHSEDHANFPTVFRSFFFGPRELKALSNQLVSELSNCTRFELLAACLWRCRTISLGLNPDEEVHLWFTVNARTKCSPPLPVGYYGNAYGLTVAMSTVAEVCNNPFGYTLELVKNAKAVVTDEFMRSLADVLVENGRSLYIFKQTYMTSDLTEGSNDIDFGWGKPLYGGSTVGNLDTSFFVPSKNDNGEDGILVTIKLAAHLMKLFIRELEKMIAGSSQNN